MLTTEEKQAVSKELHKDLYRDYVKTQSVIDFYEQNNQAELNEDTAALSKKLGDLRTKSKNLEFRKDLSNEEKLKKASDLAIQISELDGRITFCEDIKQKYKKSLDTIKEIKAYQEISEKYYLNPLK